MGAFIAVGDETGTSQKRGSGDACSIYHLSSIIYHLSLDMLMAEEVDELNGGFRGIPSRVVPGVLQQP